MLVLVCKAILRHAFITIYYHVDHDDEEDGSQLEDLEVSLENLSFEGM